MKEIFGPLLTPVPVSTEEQPQELANDPACRLTRAQRLSGKLEAVMIRVNWEPLRPLPTPFGGVTASGIGRD